MFSWWVTLKFNGPLPLLLFFFARLGALLESSVKPLGVLPPVGTYPPIGGLVFSSGGLGLVLGDLYPFVVQISGLV